MGKVSYVRKLSPAAILSLHHSSPHPPVSELLMAFDVADIECRCAQDWQVYIVIFTGNRIFIPDTKPMHSKADLDSHFSKFGEVRHIVNRRVDWECNETNKARATRAGDGRVLPAWSPHAAAQRNLFYYIFGKDSAMVQYDGSSSYISIFFASIPSSLDTYTRTVLPVVPQPA